MWPQWTPRLGVETQNVEAEAECTELPGISLDPRSMRDTETQFGVGDRGYAYIRRIRVELVFQRRITFVYEIDAQVRPA